MEWLTYLLKVTACTVLFFGFYLLVLRKLTFFKINRFYLLITLLLSFIIPALQFEVERNMPRLETELEGMPELKPIHPAPIQLIQPIVVEYQPEVTPKIDWLTLMPYAYGSIALILLLICVWRLFILLRHTGTYTKNNNGLKLIDKAKGFTNCSFFNYVFIDGSTLGELDLKVLLKHEEVHAKQYHSIDKILLMICKSVLWFNPVIYFYDKALEQVHEYEADEFTSANFGNQTYANLLLKLAISKSNMPLIHNFVKSPIKDRIKMLFHSKSKNMKKFRYLLAVPVVMGLIWLFAVQVIYAQHINDDSKPSKNFYQGMLKGKVLNTKKEAIGLYTFDLLAEGKIYPIEATIFKDKIKVGDELIVYIDAKGFNMKKMDKNGKVIAEAKGPIYTATRVTTLTGVLLYERKIENHAFLYEANKARSASSTIKSITKGVNGNIEKIVLNDGFFTINLNLATQNIKNSDFKIGDRVLAKFIGEKLVSKNTYTTDKLIVLYSEPKKYTIKNEALYNRFYFGDGKQKIVAVKNEPAKISGPVEPKIISFSKITGDVKHKISYMENAVIDIINCRLEAKYVELDRANNKMTAKNAVLKANEGGSATAKIIVFDLSNGTYVAESGNRNLKVSDGDDPDLQRIRDSLTKVEESGIDKIKNLISPTNKKQNESINNHFFKDKKLSFSSDSVKLSKTKLIYHYTGNVKIENDGLTILASDAIYVKNLNTLNARKVKLLSKDKQSIISADSITLNVENSKIKIFGKKD
ncbi:hypothetical protein ASE74_13085 [Pedobacter sp. Leaf216]|uniref:M56 family metallopeptidase n=1 Tax=Pedobacter sp. Leaf216 TaxID=1735684 RepID=UPI0006FE11EB|nr:M56 family metallopeptidase [Pedobacter sp. Leaf216]KQM78888.1 hypothetical protein ASE74_13085 [Pedobacter sp. Leaf216]